MNQVEREAIQQQVRAMTEEEQRAALECIPVQYMLDQIGRTIYQQQTFFDNVRSAITAIE